MGDWTGSQEVWRNLVAVFPAMLVAMAVAGAIGLAFERFIVRPVYGQHLKQILITMGGMIIGEELIKVIWGPGQIPLPLPDGLRGSLLVAMRRSASTACSRWRSGWSSSGCWPGRWRAPRSAC